MRTIRTMIKDGHEIITGFDDLHIDPMASRKKRAELFHASPEWQALEPKLVKLRGLRDDHCNAKLQTTPAKIEAKRAKIQADIDAITQEITNMRTVVEVAKDKAHNDGTTRFPCRQNEHKADEDEIAEVERKLSELGSDEFLLRTGDVVTHLFGVKFWRKTSKGVWESRNPKFAEKIPAAWAPETELTMAEVGEIEDQIERARITALSAGNKADEIERVKKEALAEAAHLRSKMEIAGDGDALEKSKTWYAEQVAALEDKYK